MTASDTRMLIAEGYDLEPPKEKVITHCENCGCNLHAGEDVFDIYGTIICEECIRSYKKELREES